ncbi:MAG TPA: sigma 54-interacting transcriptional regulator [Polyangiaceae bacterium]|nr:sigma 54-interacting transcriptional regulator [Polyangiaceae bacterium]
MARRARFVETTREARRQPPAARPSEPSLVLVYHPTIGRAGEVIALGERVTEIARLTPSLVDAEGGEAGPLDDPYVSRRPIVVRKLARGAVEIENAGGVEISVGGVALAAGSGRKVTADEVRRGLDVALADRVVLWLTSDHEPRGEGELGMFGRSAAMHALRAEVRDAAAAGGPVLVRGETGAGKELVAQALHAAGPRSKRPFVAVNVAAIPPAVAAAELFGHERGAFTGAGERRAGYFERAEGGVLFLDEIGELPEAVQPMLLRALELGEVQTVGGRPRRVDVAVVAATDADLEAAAAAGRFRGPLYFRLASRVVKVPPLRERGVDVGLLLARFLAEALPEGLADQTTEARLRTPASLFADLVRQPWPGNVRQLRAAAQRLAAAARAGRVASPSDLEPDLAPPRPAGGGVTSLAGGGVNDARAVDHERLLSALREHRFQLNRTAEALGVSRTHLDALIARSPRLRKAKDLGRDEIVACAEALGGDVDAMASRLEVSPRGLRLRMRQLGLAPT